MHININMQSSSVGVYSNNMQYKLLGGKASTLLLSQTLQTIIPAKLNS
jgi:hypothetical protein